MNVRQLLARLPRSCSRLSFTCLPVCMSLSVPCFAWIKRANRSEPVPAGVAAEQKRCSRIFFFFFFNFCWSWNHWFSSFCCRTKNNKGKKRKKKSDKAMEVLISLQFMAPPVNAEPKLERVSPRQRKTLKIWVSQRPLAWLLAGWLIGLSEDELTDAFSFDICSDESFSEPVTEENLFKCTFGAAELLSLLFNVLATLKQH